MLVFSGRIYPLRRDFDLNVLGINAYHADSSACLVQGGSLVAAAEEERFTRIKHWAGFPREAIRYCLGQAGIELADVDIVAINQDSGANLWEKVAYAASRRPDLALVLDRIRNKRQRSGVAAALEQAFPGQRLRAEVKHIEHHLAHLGSAFLASPFEQAVVVSVDGFGDFASAAWGLGRADGVEAENKVYFPHSLGIFYQALTQFLGFEAYGDEYKVMGLAAYGEPRFMDEMRRIVKLEKNGEFRLDLRYFRHHREKVDYEWDNGEPRVGTLFSPGLVELLGPQREKEGDLTQRDKDIARSVQAMYEEAFFHLLNRLHAHYKVDALALAGGGAMNSAANGKVYARTPFRKVYVQAAAGDAGGAVGAAFIASNRATGAGGKCAMEHAYWGPEFPDAEMAKLLEREHPALVREACTAEPLADEDELARRIAKAIADGLVVGWFQGRMEWGPRALGNRSILADPRRADMKDTLNRKIKRRESFRPFAPSVLREAAAEWFECNDDVPFMTQACLVRHEKRHLIPAVVHVDGTARLQTVRRDTNPRYHRLIEAFSTLTGVPMVLNTSFNENEPVVCSPREALDCFIRTKMDVLVLGNRVVARSG
jgi:carbamoyltransferase